MILFVGDKPSPKMKPGVKPFEGAACEKRLTEWIAILTKGMKLTSPVQIVNSNNKDLENYIGAYLDQGLPIVALGNNAYKSISIFADESYFFKLPHPSGRNRQINNKAFIDEQLKKCYDYIHKR